MPLTQRRRGMICDGGKVAALRQARMMTQDKLAIMANVDRRTIQRMEAGGSVSLETLSQVAAPLGVTAQELLYTSGVSSTSTDGGLGIFLKPERSGIRLVRSIVESDHLDFGMSFEPWREQVQIVQPFLKFLEELHPLSFDHILDYDRSIQNSAARQMEVAAQVNENLKQLAELKPEGLHVLFGQYTRWGKRVRWDEEEGCWSTHARQREEVLTVATIRIAAVSAISLRIPLQGKPVPLQT